MKGLILLYLAFLSSDYLQAYVPSETIAEKKIKWPSSKERLDITLNPTSWNLSSTNVEWVMEQSVDEWNDHAPFTLNLNTSVYASPSQDQSTISFSTNSGYFGTGVLAVTSVNYDETSGLISNATILVNESFLNPTAFTAIATSTSESQVYLGDVITHELGHLFGLGHSESYESTMLHSVFRGQHTLSDEDIHSINAHYEVSGRWIKGKVIGGSQVPVYGAYVQLVDQATASVYASTISDEDGSFVFNALESGRYSIMISPIRLSTSISSKYDNSRTDFCPGDYIVGTYSKCGGRHLGRPQVFDLESVSSIDVGNITIKCGSNVNQEYLLNKLENDYFTMDYYNGEKLEYGSFLGLFFENEIESAYADSEYDRLKIDLTDLDTSGGGYKLKINISSGLFFNQASLRVGIKREDEATATMYDPATTSLNLPEVDRSYSINLSTTTSDNIIYLDIYPQDLTSTFQTAMYAAPSIFVQKPYLYLITYDLTDAYGNTLHSHSSYPYEDNTYCTDGDYTYKVVKTNVNDALQANALSEDAGGALSCATIGNSSKKNSLFSILLGFCFVLVARLFARKISI
jgi:predicted Zn-dependent protease